MAFLVHYEENERVESVYVKCVCEQLPGANSYTGAQAAVAQQQLSALTSPRVLLPAQNFNPQPMIHTAAALQPHQPVSWHVRANFIFFMFVCDETSPHLEFFRRRLYMM